MMSSPPQQFSLSRNSNSNNKALPLELATDRGLSDVTLSGTFISPDPIVAVLSIPNNNNNSLSSSSSSSVWTAESGGWLRIRNSTTGEVEQQKRIGTNGQEPTCMCYCPASSTSSSSNSYGTVWIGTSEGPLVVYRASPDASQIAECMLHESGVTTLLFVRDKLWSAGSDGRIAIWDTAKCATVRCFTACPNGPVNCLAAVGALGVASNGGDDEGDVCVWPLERPNSSSEREEPTVVHKGAHATSVLSMCALSSSSSSTSQQLWSGAEDGSIRVWSIANNALNLITTLRCHNSAVHCIAKEPNGNRVWTASLDGRLALWDSERHSLLTQLPVSYPPRGNHFIFSVAPVATAVAQRIWSCSTDGTVRSWLSICPHNNSEHHSSTNPDDFVSIRQHQLETDELYERLMYVHGDWARGLLLIFQEANNEWSSMMQALRDRANAFAEESEQEVEALRIENKQFDEALVAERKHRLRFQNEVEALRAELDSRTRDFQRRNQEDADHYSARQQAFEAEQKRIQLSLDEQNEAIKNLREALGDARDQARVMDRKNEQLTTELDSWIKQARDSESRLRSLSEESEVEMMKLKRELEKALNTLAVQEATNERAFARASDAELEKAEMEMELASTNRRLTQTQQQLRDTDRDYKTHTAKLDSIVQDLRRQLSAHQNEVADLRSVKQRLEIDLERETSSLRSLKQSTDDEIHSLNSKNSQLREDLTAATTKSGRQQERINELEETVRHDRDIHSQQLSSLQQQHDSEIAKLRQDISHLQNECENQKRTVEELRLDAEEQNSNLDRERERARDLRHQVDEQQRTIGDLRQSASSNERRANVLATELDTCKEAADRHSTDLRETLHNYNEMQTKFNQLSRRAQEDAIALRESRDESSRLQNECRRLREQSNNLTSQLRDIDASSAERIQKERQVNTELHSRVDTLEQSLRLSQQQVEELNSALATERALRSETDAKLRATRDERVVDRESTDGLVQELKSQIQMEREVAGRSRAQIEQLNQENASLTRELTSVKEKVSRMEREHTLEQAGGASARERVQHLEASLDNSRDELRNHIDSSFKEISSLKRQVATLEAERDSAASVLDEQHAEIARLREQLHQSAGDTVRRSKELGMYSVKKSTTSTSAAHHHDYHQSSSARSSPQRLQYQQSSNYNNHNNSSFTSTPRHETKSYHDPVPHTYTYSHPAGPSSPEIPIGGYVSSNHNANSNTNTGNYNYDHRYSPSNRRRNNYNNDSSTIGGATATAAVSSSGVVTPMWSPQPRI